LRVENGYSRRWVVESLFSAVKRTFGERVGATSLPRQVLEAGLKFWTYSRMTHLANLIVGRASGVEVKG
jgi:hypothetical protein